MNRLSFEKGAGEGVSPESGDHIGGNSRTTPFDDGETASGLTGKLLENPLRFHQTPRGSEYDEPDPITTAQETISERTGGNPDGNTLLQMY